jgi:hypothetical protein
MLKQVQRSDAVTDVDSDRWNWIDAVAVTALELGDISKNDRQQQLEWNRLEWRYLRNASDSSRDLTVPAITTAGFPPW